MVRLAYRLRRVFAPVGARSGRCESKTGQKGCRVSIRPSALGWGEAPVLEERCGSIRSRSSI